MKQCPKCPPSHPTKSWDPASAGAIVARPCGHRLTAKEAALAFPEEWAAVMDELGEGYCP